MSILPIGHLHSNGDFCQTRPVDMPEWWPVPLYAQADAINAQMLGALIHIQQVACSGSPELQIATEAIRAAKGEKA